MKTVHAPSRTANQPATRPCASAATGLDADVGSQDGFWQRAHDATAARAADEGWTDDDRVAAFLQASLLSFKSDHDSADIFGRRYCPTLPEDHQHNAPWNDWTPPSKSRERFQEAIANRRPEPLETRVRVRVCASADQRGLEKSLIAFVRVDIDCKGRRCLKVLRGSDVLATMRIKSLRMECVGERMIALSPRTSANKAPPPAVFLAFEDKSRVTKFLEMLRRNLDGVP